jgi:hypothetical protein
MIGFLAANGGQALIARNVGSFTLALLVAALLAGCGSSGGSSGSSASSSSTDASAQTETRPGSAVVYQRIEAMTSCAKLQAESDRAKTYHSRELKAGDVDMAKVSTSYMEAADARIQEIGCHG